jgi:hypothetical protein
MQITPTIGDPEAEEEKKADLLAEEQLRAQAEQNVSSFISRP